jgi:SHS2 domain-containing protein
MGRYAFVEDIALADCAVDVEGRDLNDVFATAARALADLMVDPATVPPRIRRTVSLTAPALDLLLYDWLSELIFRKDRDGEVFTSARVDVRGGGPYHLTAQLEGGAIEPGTTELRADPKAVTLHQFALSQSHDDGWRARVVIDI